VRGEAGRREAMPHFLAFLRDLADQQRQGRNNNSSR